MQQTLLLIAVVVVVPVSAVVAVVLTLAERLADGVPRVPDAFDGLGGTPRPPAAGGLTFLLVGTDSRLGPPATGAAGARGDVLLLARLAADGMSAAVVSIPRDSRVDVPGHGPDEIMAAYASGGPGLLVETVETLTALHVDHFAVIDFAGFRSVVDSVGGIEVTRPAPAGAGRVTDHRDGEEASAYVRQRTAVPGGEPDGAQRQQDALRAVFHKVASTGALDDPVQLYRLLNAASAFVSVDDTLSNGDLGAVTQRMRDVPPENVSFLRAPVVERGREGARPVVHLEAPRADQLWASLRAGTTTAYVAQHGDDTLGPVIR